MSKLNLKRTVGLFAVGVLTLWASGLSVVWAETSAIDPTAVQILKRMMRLLGEPETVQRENAEHHRGLDLFGAQSR